MEKQTKITKTCEKKIDRLIIIFVIKMRYWIIMLLIMMFDLLFRRTIFTPAETKTSVGQKRQIAINAMHWVWVGSMHVGYFSWWMVRANEHLASKQLHQIFARMTNQPTSSLWRWGCGDERTEMRTPDCGKQRRSSEAFHGRTVHDHCGAWLMPQRRCYGCDRRWDRRLSLCQSWGCITKGNSFLPQPLLG